MPSRSEQNPREIPEEKSTLYKGARIPSYLTIYGSGLAGLGADSNRPLLTAAGIGLAAIGAAALYIDSETALNKTIKTVDKLNEIDDPNIESKKRDINEKSNDFIGSHRTKVLKSIGASLSGGYLVGISALNRDWSNTAIGIGEIMYGQYSLYTSIEKTDKNIDSANKLIQESKSNPES